MPASPVHRDRKFSAVLGAISVNNSNTTRPKGIFPTVTSKKTRGRSFFEAIFIKTFSFYRFVNTKRKDVFRRFPLIRAELLPKAPIFRLTSNQRQKFEIGKQTYILCLKKGRNVLEMTKLITLDLAATR